jgi:hypothetical protein
MIALREVLFQMDSETPFKVRVVKCNRIKKTGGEIREYTAVLNQPKRNNSGKKFNAADFARRSNVNDNGTLTIRLMGTEDVRTIHKRLIRKFNGQQVI